MTQVLPHTIRTANDVLRFLDQNHETIRGFTPPIILRLLALLEDIPIQSPQEDIPLDQLEKIFGNNDLLEMFEEQGNAARTALQAPYITKSDYFNITLMVKLLYNGNPPEGVASNADNLEDERDCALFTHALRKELSEIGYNLSKDVRFWFDKQDR